MSVARLSWLACLVIAAGTSGTVLGQVSTDPSPGSSVDAEPDADDSPWGWVKLPTITMPTITMPKMPEDPLAPLKASARKVSEGTRRAWEGTRELFTFGGEKQSPRPSSRVASKPQPSFWQRMFGGAEEEPQGPQSVAEWMSQPRLDP